KAWAIKTRPFVPMVLNVSPDGRYAAVVGWERLVAGNTVLHVYTELHLIDLATQAVRLSTHVMSDLCDVKFVVWSPDGRRIAVGGNSYEGGKKAPPALQLIDASTGQPTASFPRQATINALAFSPDGKYLVVAWRNAGVEIWNAEHTKLIQR